MKFFAFVPAFSLLALSQLADAQPASPPASGRTDLITPPESIHVQSTEITSDGVEMWSTDNETLGTFSGNVVVTGNDLKLTCDRLEITATRIGEKTATIGTLEKFKYLLASGKVRIVQGDREATCGRAEVFPREDKVILTDKPMVVDHGADATYVGTQLRLFRGKRRVEGDDVKITLPPIKDLGFDKDEPPPKADDVKPTAPTAAPTVPERKAVPPSPAHK